MSPGLPFGTAILTAALALAGCAGVPGREESSARNDMRATGARLLAREGRPALPVLRVDSPAEDFIRFAVLNHPAVVAAYYDWRASVEDIVPARSLPDPQFIFQADITNSVSSLMPGLMFNFLGSGKRAAMGREAASASGIARRSYITAVLDTAAEARTAWIELAYIDEAARLQDQSIGAIESALEIADSDYATGRGMGTLADQVRVANDLAKARSERAALDDRRASARARFKSALGLRPTDSDPAWPVATLAPTRLPDRDQLWQRACEMNPELGRMRTMIEMAVDGVGVARKAGSPDFTVGTMVDLRTNPTLVRPLGTLNLPIWREKIAAILAAAEARRDASLARYSAAELNLAAAFAQALYRVRESDRRIAYIDGEGLPYLERSLATAEAAYQSGTANPGMIPETQVMALGMRLERVGALRDREAAVVDLTLLTSDVAPLGSPMPESEPQS
ncbi:MAG: TolC family protein [Opitutaceae bacterium]